MTGNRWRFMKGEGNEQRSFQNAAEKLEENMMLKIFYYPDNLNLPRGEILEIVMLSRAAA